MSGSQSITIRRLAARDIRTGKHLIEIVEADDEIWISKELLESAASMLTIDPQDDRFTIHAVNAELVYQIDRTRPDPYFASHSVFAYRVTTCDVLS